MVHENAKELLWRRLQDAKLQLDRAHRQITEVKGDKISGAVPSPDGNYAQIVALRGHELAVTDYLKALGDLKAALLGHQDAVGRAEPTNPIPDSLDPITPREREVLGLIASGKSSRQIAAQLGITFRTVVAHRYHLSTKLKAHKAADLTKAALRMGLVEL